MRCLSKNPAISRFLHDAFKNLRDNNVSVEFRRSKRVKVGTKQFARGYFDGTSIVVAKNDPRWLSVFVHEYCHFLQMLEKQRDYVLFEKSRYHDNMMVDWIDGKYKNSRVMTATIERLLRMEIDCEKRSVSLIRQYELPIDIIDYIQEANMILFTYHIVVLHKLLDTGKVMLKLKKSQAKKSMPDKLSHSFAKKAPKKVLKKMLESYEQR